MNHRGLSSGSHTETNQDWAEDWDFTADPVTRRLRVWVEVAGFASLDSTPGRSPHLPCILVAQYAGGRV